MKRSIQELIALARSVAGGFSLGEDGSAGGVGAAILTAGGNVYTGVCTDLSCGLGFCAEVSAMAQMVTRRETHIDTVVAATRCKILPPCGRCREMMAQVDCRILDCAVVIDEKRVVRLRDLLPDHWLTQTEKTESARRGLTQ